MSSPTPNSIKLLEDEFLNDVKQKIISGEIKDHSKNFRSKFVDLFDDYVNSSKCFELQNIELFPIKETIIGCHHFLDGILLQYGIANVQILEHEYKYYEKLNPNWQWAVPGNLKPNQPLIIASPFPGYLDLHPSFDDLLDEASEKQIDVHLDCAWLSCSNNVTIDVSHPSIKTIGISLSKGFASSWNRIGIRYSKLENLTDPITIFNRARMCPEPCVRAGINLLETVPIDYMWNTYGKKYYDLINKYNLDEGKILFAAYGKDRIIYSLSELLTSNT